MAAAILAFTYLDKIVAEDQVDSLMKRLRWSPRFGQVVKSGFCS
jgi:hypothetical protein